MLPLCGGLKGQDLETAQEVKSALTQGSGNVEVIRLSQRTSQRRVQYASSCQPIVLPMEGARTMACRKLL